MALEAVTAGSGDTTLPASGTGNALTGGSGNDVLRVLSGSGSNTADYSAAPVGVAVNLAMGTASNGYGGTDRLINIHSVLGSACPDTLTGAAGVADTFDGKGAPAGTQDTEIGNGGDTFIFDPGYGALGIDESDPAADPSNTLRRGAGIAPRRSRSRPMRPALAWF